MAKTAPPPPMYVIHEVVCEDNPGGPRDARFEMTIRRTRTVTIADLPPAVRSALAELMRKDPAA